MRVRITRVEEAIANFIEDTVYDLYSLDMPIIQVREIEKSLLTNICKYMQRYAYSIKGIDATLKKIADTMTENSTCIYEYDEIEGAIIKHRPIDVFREYKKQTTARIFLNPYIAQYERI